MAYTRPAGGRAVRTPYVKRKKVAKKQVASKRKKPPPSISARTIQGRKPRGILRGKKLYKVDPQHIDHDVTLKKPIRTHALRR